MPRAGALLCLTVVAGGLALPLAGQPAAPIPWTDQDVADAVALGLLSPQLANEADLDRPITLGEFVRLLLEARPALRGVQGEPGPAGGMGPPGPAGPVGARAPAGPALPAADVSYGQAGGLPVVVMPSPQPTPGRRDQILDWVVASASGQGARRQRAESWAAQQPRVIWPPTYCASGSTPTCDCPYCRDQRRQQDRIRGLEYDRDRLKQEVESLEERLRNR